MSSDELESGASVRNEPLSDLDDNGDLPNEVDDLFGEDEDEEPQRFDGTVLALNPS
jgi:hypothetical protein